MEESKDKNKVKVVVKDHAGSGAIYGLGLIGAVIYYVQHAVGFVGILVGIAKGVFWPAVVVYKVLEILYQ